MHFCVVLICSFFLVVLFLLSRLLYKDCLFFFFKCNLPIVSFYRLKNKAISSIMHTSLFHRQNQNNGNISCHFYDLYFIFFATGGYASFQSCFPYLCESENRPPCPTRAPLSQPCLPVANTGPTRVLGFLYLGSQQVKTVPLLILHYLSM